MPVHFLPPGPPEAGAGAAGSALFLVAGAELLPLDAGAAAELEGLLDLQVFRRPDLEIKMIAATTRSPPTTPPTVAPSGAGRLKHRGGGHEGTVQRIQARRSQQKRKADRCNSRMKISDNLNLALIA